MPIYNVTWDIEVSADSPTAAARLALEIQRDPISLATNFDVYMVAPCPGCKKHLVHKSACRYAKSSGSPFVDHHHKIEVPA